MPSLNLKFVQKEGLRRYWPSCESLIERGLRYSQGEASSKHILKELESERAQLIVGEDVAGFIHSALVIQFQMLPNYTVAHVYSIGGSGVMENRHHWKSIKSWIKAHGAIKVQGICRPAQARLWRRLGFESIYQIVSVEL